MEKPLRLKRFYPPAVLLKIVLCLLFFAPFFHSALWAQAVYDRETKLHAGDPEVYDHFGSSVAIWGERAIVGTMAGDGYGKAAYIYRFDGIDWLQEAKLTADDPQWDLFGVSVDIYGDYAIVGAPYDDAPTYHSGSAYVFKFDGHNWIRLHKLTSGDTTSTGSHADFGRAVSIYENIAVVGAPSAFAGDFPGLVYVFEFQDSTWLLQQILEKYPEDRMGTSVDFDGNTIIAGANGSAYGAPRNAVSLYNFDGFQWALRQRIVSSDTTMMDNFGGSVSIDGNFAAIGAYEDHVTAAYSGAAYIFRFDGNQWVRQQKLKASNPTANSFFGLSVSMSDDIAVIGAFGFNNNKGAVYIFKNMGLSWNEKTRIEASDGADDDQFGCAVAIYEKSVIAGAYGDDDSYSNSGSAYIYELVARPDQVEASNGTYSNRLRIGWVNRSSIVESYKVFRNGEEIATLLSGAQSYNDNDAIPGKIYSYGIAAYHSMYGNSGKAQTRGWRRTNGKIDGKVRSTMGAGVANVNVSALPAAQNIPNVLDFDGVNDYVEVPHADDLNLSRWSIEAWIYPTNAGDVISRVPDNLPNFNMRYNDNNQQIIIEFSDQTGNVYSVASQSNSVPLNRWTHVCTILDSSRLSLLVDGRIDNSMAVSAQPNVGVAPVYLGKGLTGYFAGMIDELRLWSIPLDTAIVRKNMFRFLNGNEPGLVAYWMLEDSSRSSAMVAGDFAEGRGHHGIIKGATWKVDSIHTRYAAQSDPSGYYALRNLFYDESREFEITPAKGDHGFDPSKQHRTLEMITPTAAGVDFTDTTSYSVIGKIQYAGTRCNVKDVEILVNGITTGVYTDGNGVFRISIEEPGTYTITPSYKDSSLLHTFQPVDTTLFIEDDVLDLNFRNTQSHLLHGRVRAACNAVLGTAWVNIRSIDHNWGNFDSTFVTDSQGNFRLFFPAQKYRIDVVDLNPSNPLVVQYFEADTVDLTWQNARKNFTYRQPPVIKISGLEEWGSGVYAVPILEQFAVYRLTIDVLDVFGTDSCQVDSGTVTFYDDVGGNPSQPTTYILQNGRITYDLMPKEVNILGGGPHPYQKLFQIVAKVGQETSSLEQWMLVTGHRPREQTFSSTTPELPLLILRDPPGDESYCYQSRDSTINLSYVNSFSSAREQGLFLDAKIGGVFSVGFITETSFGAYAMFAADLNAGKETTFRSGNLFSLTTTEEFRTSNRNLVVGPKGDVFVGASLNSVYALTDILEYDFSNAQVLLDTSLVWGIEGFNTTYVYTEYHIRNTLLPQLRMLRSLSVSDSLQMLKLDAAIDIWHQVLERNEQLKQQAVFEKNISFSAGTTTSYSTTVVRQGSFTIDYTQFFEVGLSVGLGVVAAGVPIERGYKTKWKWTSQVVATSEIQNRTTIGYTFGDGDPGDFFSVNVKQDKLGFGTPVFELVAGTSSCPWESGTQPRDGVDLGINKFAQYNVPPAQPAAFTLTLGNTSQSGESREYHLRVIQGSNPDGAVIKVAGVAMGGALSYYIPPGEQFTAGLTVERGPLAFDYENLQLMLYPPCEYEIWQQNMPLSIVDTVTFSVHFTGSCSQAALLLPENNWVVNQSDNDTLQVIITGYNINNPYLENLKLQYRRYGQNWQTAYVYPKQLLPPDYIVEYWNVSSLPDGKYELRVAADCGSRGVSYCTVASGIIDRQALIVFGAPQPSDGVLNIGEVISVAFSGDVDCALINPLQDVSLITADDSSSIAIEISCYQNILTITPMDSLVQFENRILRATVSGLKDLQGNILRKPVSWTFRVSRNPVYWTVSNVTRTIYQGSEDSFTRRLTNVGILDESFNISYYPAWLTPTPWNGIIPAGGEQEVVFLINALLNVGSYLDTVLVSTVHGSEQLLVKVDVLKMPPSWTVNASQYAFSMNVTAQIAFEDGISRDIFDMVSVFVNEEIRAVANVEYVATIKKYLAFLTVYSNQASGERLKFRLWDASKGREHVFQGGNYTFTSNASLGSLTNPVLIEPDATVMEIELSSGWNWISNNVEASDMSISTVLGGLTPADGDLIKGQTHFCQYLAGVGWQGNLSRVETGKSYRIFLNEAENLRLTGAPVDVISTVVPLDTGWNWIGYLHQDIYDINNALSSLQPVTGDRIKSQTEFAEYISASGTWEGSLKKMLPGQGYLLKSQAGGTLQYPRFGKSGNNPGSGKLIIAGKPDWSVDPASYEYNMSVTAVCRFGQNDMQDTTLIIAAFRGSQCMGISRLRYIPELQRYLVFLMLYSDHESGDSLSFKVYEPSSDKTRLVEGVMVFESDQILGNLGSPHVFTVIPIGDELVPYDFYLQQNYPNPFNPVTQIEFGIPRNEHVKLFIYNTLGQKVLGLVDGPQPAGRYKLTFNSRQHSLASGIYFYWFKAGSFERTFKMVILR